MNLLSADEHFNVIEQLTDIGNEIVDRLNDPAADLTEFLLQCELEPEDDGGNYTIIVPDPGATIYLQTADQALTAVSQGRRVTVKFDRPDLFQRCDEIYKETRGLKP